MSMTLHSSATTKPVHDWLRQVRVAFVPGPMTALLEEVAGSLLERFRLRGHEIQEAPNDDTDVLLTSAPFGQPIGWRQAMLFSARRRFGLKRSPTVFTLVHADRAAFQQALAHFEQALAKDPPDPADFQFEGLAPTAYHVLLEQGRRGGPILALERLIQAQAKSIRVILVVGEERPEIAYHFDLVGAHPTSDGSDPEAFYDDIVLRIVTAVSTHEVTNHKVLEEVIPRSVWEQAEAVEHMRHAALELDKRAFFTDMVRIADLVQVPAVGDAVASQYSEGCFATWEPRLNALIATVTGSARPVDKGNVTEDDLAVIVGVQPDGSGAIVRHVEDKRNDPPSSEAVEMMEMDRALPRIRLGPEWGIEAEVPVVRSKLHGHRGVAAYDPQRVEYVPLDPPYFYYLVSCATEAQAHAVKAAFARSEALQNPEDPRQLVFTVLPGHGIVIAEKWVAGKRPFQVIWEAMDAGSLEVENRVPQGPVSYIPSPEGRHVLHTEA